MNIKLLIAIFSLAASCSKSNQLPSDINPVSPTTDTVYSFLSLGDSYTIGTSVTEAERFPAQTADLLRQQGLKIKEPRYIATNGWTTINLQNAINASDVKPVFDIVTLLIGVNDQYQGLDTSGYAIRFGQLLSKAIFLAGGKKERVFVLSIPDYSVTPFVSASNKALVRKEIDWFNAINKRITEANQVSYTDITQISREAETNPALIANDNLHPSGLQYKKWAMMLAPKIKAALP